MKVPVPRHFYGVMGMGLRYLFQIRSYHVEYTASHQNCEVKRHWAYLVLRWGTTWEQYGAVSFFPFLRFSNEFLIQAYDSIFDGASNAFEVDREIIYIRYSNHRFPPFFGMFFAFFAFFLHFQGKMLNRIFTISLSIFISNKFLVYHANQCHFIYYFALSENS